MEIYLKRITLLNFKGIKKKTFTFTERETTILGANGTGKTSLFDAFTWLLFGKDHKGKENHQLKTWDENGKIIHRLDCTVEGLLIVGGREVLLKRIYSEEWNRQRGTSKDIMKGHKIRYFIDDVPVKKSEYDQEVSKICSEEVFRVITNPSYFPSLEKESQRSLLLRMIGTISDADVANQNPDFRHLLEQLSGKSLDAFRSEIANKKKRLNEELKDIPSRIDELNRTIPTALVWSRIIAEIENKNAEFKEVSGQLEDAAKLSQGENRRRLDLQDKINSLKRSNQSIQFSAQSERDNQVNSLEAQIRQLKNKKQGLLSDYDSSKNRLELLRKRINEDEAKLNELTQAWHSINAEVLQVDPDQLFCPTCDTPFTGEKLETKQAELTDRFNKDKSKRLQKNVDEGSALAAGLKKMREEVKSLENFNSVDTNEIDQQIQKLEKQIQTVCANPLGYENNPDYVKNLDKINQLQAELDTPIENHAPDQSLKERKDTLSKELEKLKGQLATKDIIERTQKRIQELTGQEDVLNQELADLESMEFTIKNFEFAKNELYETAIDQLFRIVKFRLFREQVDGQIVPDCECMINGVPYSTLNNASQVAAGLDIIHTICQYENTYAPIWLDNRESVSEIPFVNSQVINLVVDKKEPVLRISNENH